jgi:Holliday junction DNA helicase RuvA
VYESIRGTLRSKDAAACVVEAGGIGYAVSVPLSTAERLPRAGEETVLLLHLAVREDEWRLFGFATEDERRVFRACLTVAGVGPATAMALLSGMRPADLAIAVSSGDVKALTRVKGVGRKTAERLVVELRDVLSAGGVPGRGPALPTVAADAARALVSLGLDPAEAEDRVRRHHAADAASTVEDLVRRALRG